DSVTIGFRNQLPRNATDANLPTRDVSPPCPPCRSNASFKSDEVREDDAPAGPRGRRRSRWLLQLGRRWRHHQRLSPSRSLVLVEMSLRRLKKPTTQSGADPPLATSE